MPLFQSLQATPALTFEELKELDKQVVTEGTLPTIGRDAVFGALVGAVVGLLDGGVIDGAVKGAAAGAVLSYANHRWLSWVSEVEHVARGEV